MKSSFEGRLLIFTFLGKDLKMEFKRYFHWKVVITIEKI